MSPLTQYDTIAPNLEIFGILILMYMPIRGTNIILIGQEMYDLSAPENKGRVLLQHKVCISVACGMCCRI